MKKLISLILTIMLLTSSAAFAMDVLDEHIDVTTPTNKYVYVGRATLIDPSKPGYLILSLSASSDAFHTMLDLLDNTYGSATNIPGLSDFLPGSEYIDLAKWGMDFVDSGVKCYMKICDPETGASLWDGTWLAEDGKDRPFKDGKVIYLGNDHAAYDLYFKSPSVIAHSFVRLGIAENVSWTNP